MSEITRIVCDACEWGDKGGAKLVKLEMQIKGDGGFFITADVHNTTRCIARVVRKLADKHFEASQQPPEAKKPEPAKAPELAKPAETRQPVVAKR